MVTTPAKPKIETRPAGSPLELAVPIKLKLPADWDPTDEALIELSRINQPWDFEVTADRELVFVSPERPGSSERGADLIAQIRMWCIHDAGGHVFGPQLGVRREDGSMRMPDVAWMSDLRWGDRELDQGGLLDASPELIVEVVSATDSAEYQQEKMVEWMGHGASLGWLIDPSQATVRIYRPDAEPELLQRPDTLNGEDVCDGLEVSLERVWK